ncbi:MAG TPA: tetratricopeptide repeat protein, partial [Polyangiales bacterium]|nr:tetratricopeptide repeat protein [Polyangiales bacterium]
YEEKLVDPNNAMVAWVQAVVHDPQDTRALRAVERLATGSDLRMAEALETLTAAAQQSHATLFGDEQAARAAAEQELAQAQAGLAQVRQYVEQSAEARSQQDKQARAARGDEVSAAEENVAAAYAQVEALQATHGQLSLRVRELEQAIEAKRAEHEALHGSAEAAVEAYEQAEASLGEAPSEEQQAQFAELAGNAERLVEAAGVIEAEIETLTQELQGTQAQAQQSDAELTAALSRGEAAEAAVQQLRGDDLELLEDDDDDASAALALSDDEAAQLAQAEQRVQEAEAAVARYTQMDESERATQRRRELSGLVQLYVIMGRWYATRLGRPDFALSCFTQALGIDAEHDAAFDGIVDLYRASQAWAELASTLLTRADRSGNPVKARSARAQAAVILAQRIGDEAQARAQLERVLHEDPAHAVAQDALGDILTKRKDYPALAELLERRLSALDGEAKIQTRLELAELYEDRLDQMDRAEAHFRAVVEAAHRKLDAWKGLERIAARKENYEGLLSSLRAQVELASTPRQRIALHERIGLLLEEEFVNHAEAAGAFEEIVAIDPTNDAANTALARLYRQLSRFEDVVATLHRHATTTPDDKRKIELMLQAVRVLTVDIGSPERAMEMCERILEVDSEEPEALSELARLKSTAGDVSSALAAIERLADNEQDAQKRSDLWVRAGKLLEEGGDRDGAISR